MTHVFIKMSAHLQWIFGIEPSGQLGILKKKKKKECYKGSNETSDIQRFYCYSYFFLTGNDSGVMGFFFPENCEQSVEVSAEINGSLIFDILDF